MRDERKLQLGSLKETLDRVPFALTISDLTEPDQPLIYMNPAFQKITGYTDDDLGRNCRFLQGDLDNEQPRAEIRQALSERRRTQVILRNRRANGEQFYNLLLLEPINSVHEDDRFALGAQFELTETELDELDTSQSAGVTTPLADIKNTALRLRLERRRIAASSSVQMFKSWLTLNRLSA